VVGGADDIWAFSVRANLTYCISTAFGANHARTVTEMAQATADWEAHGDYNFVYVPAQDGVCTNANTNVVFAVRPRTEGGACAFFPSGGGCVPRTLVMNYASFASGAVTSQGVYRHELGHVLGLRHEHIRAPGTSCIEGGTFRGVTAYDSASVMHYPWCTGARNTGDLFITSNDALGINTLYSPPIAFQANTTAFVGRRPGWSRQHRSGYGGGNKSEHYPARHRWVPGRVPGEHRPTLDDGLGGHSRPGLRDGARNEPEHHGARGWWISDRVPGERHTTLVHRVGRYP